MRNLLRGIFGRRLTFTPRLVTRSLAGPQHVAERSGVYRTGRTRPASRHPLSPRASLLELPVVGSLAPISRDRPRFTKAERRAHKRRPR